jgi:hypothetical protein
MKIAFGMIVFEGDYVLQECLDAVYPYAEQILVAEGPVSYWRERGRTTSTDRTNEILDSYYDPHNKLTVVHSQFREKDDQCRAYMPHLRDDIDYIWNLDSDEVYKGLDLEKMINLLEEEQYTSVGMRSCSFYGGLDRYIGGFEQAKDNFLRIFKVYPGATWKTHRPPTIISPKGSPVLPEKHLDSDTLWYEHGIQMYHYSYVFPSQVKNKLEYYKAAVSKNNCHPDYFNQVYLPWVTGDDRMKRIIEDCWAGVHEFRPESRGPSYTIPFEWTHPTVIDRTKIESRIHNELHEFLAK